MTALAAHGPDAVLARMGLRLGPVRVQLLNHHPGSRCTFLAAGPRGRAVVKAFAGDTDALVGVLDRLRTAGLASGEAPTAPPLLGSDPTLRLLTMGFLGGPTAWDLIDHHQGERAGALAAAWLRSADGLGEPRPAGAYDATEVCRDGERWVRSIARRDVKLAAHAAARMAELAASAPTRSAMRMIHGSFSPSHVLDLGAGPGVIDWDNAGVGAIEYDVGLFLASLRRGRAAAAPRGEVERARRALTSGISGLADEEAARWYEAACVVKLAKYLASRRPPGWRERAVALLAPRTLRPRAGAR